MYDEKKCFKYINFWKNIEYTQSSISRMGEVVLMENWS